jgi:hypothetical protein
LNLLLNSKMMESGTGGEVSNCLSIMSLVILSKSEADIRSALGSVSSMVRDLAILLYWIPAIL